MAFTAYECASLIVSIRRSNYSCGLTALGGGNRQRLECDILPFEHVDLVHARLGADSSVAPAETRGLGGHTGTGKENCEAHVLGRGDTSAASRLPSISGFPFGQGYSRSGAKGVVSRFEDAVIYHI